MEIWIAGSNPGANPCEHPATVPTVPTPTAFDFRSQTFEFRLPSSDRQTGLPYNPGIEFLTIRAKQHTTGDRSAVWNACRLKEKSGFSAVMLTVDGTMVGSTIPDQLG